MSVLSTKTGNMYNRNLISYAAFICDRVSKMFLKVWPTYMNALRDTDANFGEWKHFITSNLFLLTGKEPIEKPSDSKTNICCVYTDGDRNHAMSSYGFATENVISVGNPDLEMFGFTESLTNCFHLSQLDNEDVIYIDTAMLARGAIFSNLEENIDHLVQTNLSLLSQGKKLVVKLHPDQFRTNLPQRLNAAGVKICKNEKFIPRLKNCCAAIVEPSSAAVIPALMGLPLFWVKYNKFVAQPYGDIITSYPYGKPLNDIANFKMNLIDLVHNRDNREKYNWIAYHKGPDPKRMPEAVSKIIKGLVECS